MARSTILISSSEISDTLLQNQPKKYYANGFSDSIIPVSTSKTALNHHLQYDIWHNVSIFSCPSEPRSICSWSGRLWGRRVNPSSISWTSICLVTTIVTFFFLRAYHLHQMICCCRIIKILWLRRVWAGENLLCGISFRS